ncbi:MAG: hypothetical protein RJA59_1652 [Pseudomonadota bacterium]|jgi:hypothetical protein
MIRSPRRLAILADPGLGSLADAVIARRHGVSPAEVQRLRAYAGVGRASRATVAPRILRHPDLGRVPDRELARRLRVSQTAVWRARRAKGLGPPPMRRATQAAVIERRSALREWLATPRTSAEVRERAGELGLVDLDRDLRFIGAVYSPASGVWRLP